MEITNELLAKYVGGQLQSENRNEDYLYRGEVERAWIEGVGLFTTLHVRFKWLAKLRENGKWYNMADLDFSVNVAGALFYSIGVNFYYNLFYSAEFGKFSPPDGEKLDPRKVIGLFLPKKEGEQPRQITFEY